MSQIRHEELICEAKIPDFTKLPPDHNCMLEVDGNTESNKLLYHSQYREDNEKKE